MLKQLLTKLMLAAMLTMRCSSRSRQTMVIFLLCKLLMFSFRETSTLFKRTLMRTKRLATMLTLRFKPTLTRTKLPATMLMLLCKRTLTRTNLLATTLKLLYKRTLTRMKLRATMLTLPFNQTLMRMKLPATMLTLPFNQTLMRMKRLATMLTQLCKDKSRRTTKILLTTLLTLMTMSSESRQPLLTWASVHLRLGQSTTFLSTQAMLVRSTLVRTTIL